MGSDIARTLNPQIGDSDSSKPPLPFSRGRVSAPIQFQDLKVRLLPLTSLDSEVAEALPRHLHI